MTTKDDRNLPLDPYGLKKRRLNDATPEEWNSAIRGYEKPEEGTEFYQSQLFSGSLWDEADKQTRNDEVNEPKHYNYGKYETIDVIVDTLGEYEAISYCHGNVLKYTMRMWHKGRPITDCKKARWYLNKMIELLEKTEGINW
jgi:phage/plasmid-associated DNA primase